MYILEQERSGNLILKRYSELTENEKISISNKVIRAIHMQHLINADKNCSSPEEADFYKMHFRNEWDTAANMSQPEVDTMMKQWKAT